VKSFFNLRENKAVRVSRKESVELDENRNLLKDYEKYMSQGGKKTHNAIDYLMSMSQYKRYSRDQMAKIIGDALRKGTIKIRKESVELDEAIDFRKAFMDIQSYAKKSGGIDKTDSWQ
jgi:hypothetical protein